MRAIPPASRIFHQKGGEKMVVLTVYRGAPAPATYELNTWYQAESGVAVIAPSGYELEIKMDPEKGPLFQIKKSDGAT